MMNPKRLKHNLKQIYFSEGRSRGKVSIPKTDVEFHPNRHTILNQRHTGVALFWVHRDLLMLWNE